MPISLEELRSLSAHDKLRLIEFLWDELELSVESMPPQGLAEVRRRLAELQQDPELGVPLEVMRHRFAHD